MGKRRLHAFPKDRHIIGIDTDANNEGRFRLGALAQIPVDRCGFGVAHGRHHRSEGSAADGAQAFLQALRDVNGIQVSPTLGHGGSLPLLYTL